VADTQWPRYLVFEQPDDGSAFILAGSVHAPDGEMALLVARDTFARRPKRTAMWVARADRVSSRTREQLLADPEVEPAGAGDRRYQVFAKRSHRGVHEHMGEVAAPDPEGAIRSAAGGAGGDGVIVWLAVSESDLRRSEPADREVLYASSPGKPFRHESEYPVRTMMMDLKRKKQERA
jgi:ring-1,2-phenylacetyl-CoA epoxidase subunit PaaB